MTKRVFALFTAICLLCGLALGGMAVPAYASDSDPENVEMVDGLPEGWFYAKNDAGGASQTSFTVEDDPEESGNKVLKLYQKKKRSYWCSAQYIMDPTSQVVTLEYRYKVDANTTGDVFLPSFRYYTADEETFTFPLLLRTNGGQVAYSNATSNKGTWVDVCNLNDGGWYNVKQVVDIVNKTFVLHVGETIVELDQDSDVVKFEADLTQISGVLTGFRNTTVGTVYLDDMVVTVGTSGEEVEEPVIENSLSLKGNIGVNYYISIPDAVENDASAFIRFTQGDKYEDTPISQGVLDGDDKLFTWPVAAKEMGDEIKAQIFYGEDQSPLFPEENSYSVKDYAEYIENDYTGEDKEIWQNLMTAMLNYGALAQMQFGYKTDKPVANLDNLDLSAVTATTLMPFQSNGKGTEKAKFCGTGLLLESGTTLRVYFKVADDAALTVNNGELTVQERGGYHYVDIENIYAPDLGKPITLTVNDGTGAEAAEITVCPLSYCYDALNGGTEDTTLLNLVKALYQYYAAAVEAFQE